MAITINCPNCHGKVRSPEELIGKKVQCPKCSTVFRVEAPNAGIEVVDDIEVVEDEPAPRPKRRPPVDAEVVDDRPRRRLRDEEDDVDDYEPRPRRGGRSRALAKAKPPGIALLVVGILGILYAIVNALTLAVAGPAANPFANNANVDPTTLKVGNFIGAGLTFVYGAVVTFGGLKMMRLENWSSVLTASIFAMLPCNCACFLGLPVGIWTLVALNSPEVKRAFDG